jgi:hypothetical protein
MWPARWSLEKRPVGHDDAEPHVKEGEFDKNGGSGRPALRLLPVRSTKMLMESG